MDTQVLLGEEAIGETGTPMAPDPGRALLLPRHDLDLLHTAVHSGEDLVVDVHVPLAVLGHPTSLHIRSSDMVAHWRSLL